MEALESANPFSLNLPYKWMYESTRTDFECDAYLDIFGLDWSQLGVAEPTSSRGTIQENFTNIDVDSLSVTMRKKKVAKTHTKIQLKKSKLGGGFASSMSSKKSENGTHCSKQPRQKEGMKSKRTIGKSKRVHLCPYCNKSFPWESKLIIHIRAHTNERPFTCIICGCSFKFKDNLISHLCMVHSRPYFRVNRGRSGMDCGNSSQHFICYFCGKASSGMKKSRSHMVKFHQKSIKETNL